MTGLVAGAALAAALVAVDAPPRSITVSTARGQHRIEVRTDAAGAPLLPAPALVGALGGTIRLTPVWAEVTIAQQSFRFLLGAPAYLLNDKLQVLAAPVNVARDTLFLPLQFVAEVLPTFLGERYRYDRRNARLVEDRSRFLADNAPGASKPGGRLRPGHVVTVDAGHGGVDPGNPGLYFPRGVREKDVTLQVALLLRDELKRRGVAVRMTRTTDTLIALGDRGGYCSANCDLFVSLHVNSLARRKGFTDRRGFETYFLAEAKTEDAERVARMENEAVRFEAGSDETEALTGIDFIVKDLQLNEHLRESARLAELVQGGLGRVHTGPDLGVKQAGFMVLTSARRPAVLVEMGYSTNPHDARYLASVSGQRRLAASIADAVVDYLQEYERRTDATADSGLSAR
ncbi:MAG TPA: N-acetylmuramoyl-L-alanine amidase [Gemmatimonadales bacterium]|jgi:N-acetylmuramoyl-L-alanine amidase|nr:N-acetylmuramoyl-L-alanine amidase [Gemmatimonadales bacterium]